MKTTVSLSASHLRSLMASRFDDEDIVSMTSGFGELKTRDALKRRSEYRLVLCFKSPLVKITMNRVPSGEKLATWKTGLLLKYEGSPNRVISIASVTVTARCDR